MLLLRIIGYIGILLAFFILFESEQDHAIWRSVIVFGASSVLLYLPEDYEFSLRHIIGLTVAGAGFYLYYIGVQDWAALFGFFLLIGGGYFADILSPSGGNDAGDFPDENSDGSGGGD